MTKTNPFSKCSRPSATKFWQQSRPAERDQNKMSSGRFQNNFSLVGRDKYQRHFHNAPVNVNTVLKNTGRCARSRLLSLQTDKQ